MTVIEKIEKNAHKAHWAVLISESGNELTFERFTPAGQNAIIEVTISAVPQEEVFENIYEDLKRFVDNFDVSYETYLWLDESGHGKNGAPHDMKDVYEDMETYLEYAKELRDAFNKI